MSAGSGLQHISWLAASTAVLVTADGRPVSHWKFGATHDAAVWSAWARHFRAQYIQDDLIDALKKGTEFASRADYLRGAVFPDEKQAPGPSVRSGDFCEVLVADLLESNLGYYVPRTRFHLKAVRNESVKGSDVIALKILSPGKVSPRDVLAIYEVKGKLTGSSNDGAGRLQDAINDSCKDDLRRSESLNAAKRRLLEFGRTTEADMVERFQNATDTPYQYQPGAAAVVSTSCWNVTHLGSTSCVDHPHASTVDLVVIEADDFMGIVSELYRLAADEA